MLPKMTTEGRGDSSLGFSRGMNRPPSLTPICPGEYGVFSCGGGKGGGRRPTRTRGHSASCGSSPALSPPSRLGSAPGAACRGGSLVDRPAHPPCPGPHALTLAQCGRPRAGDQRRPTVTNGDQRRPTVASTPCTARAGRRSPRSAPPPGRRPPHGGRSWRSVDASRPPLPTTVDQTVVCPDRGRQGPGAADRPRWRSASALWRAASCSGAAPALLRRCSGAAPALLWPVPEDDRQANRRRAELTWRADHLERCLTCDTGATPARRRRDTGATPRPPQPAGAVAGVDLGARRGGDMQGANDICSKATHGVSGAGHAHTVKELRPIGVAPRTRVIK